MKSPIIIIGSGRSGSTLIADVLSNHKDLVYPSQITSVIPRRLFWSRLYLRLAKAPVIGGIFKKSIKISESYPFWDTLFNGFADPYRNLNHSDVMPYVKNRINGTMDKLKIGKDSRLLIKITGWPRIGFLKEIFPDAKFVNVIRDGHDVAYSLMNVNFWKGWRGPGNWRLGDIPKKYSALYHEYDESFVVLAGIYWNIIMDATNNDIDRYKPDIINVKYSEFCSNTNKVLDELTDFCRLSEDKNLGKKAGRYKINNNNGKWITSLTDSQKEALSITVKDWNSKLGLGYDKK